MFEDVVFIAVDFTPPVLVCEFKFFIFSLFYLHLETANVIGENKFCFYFRHKLFMLPFLRRPLPGSK